MRSDLLFDFNHMMEESAGPDGLSRKSLDGLKKRFAEVHRGFVDLRRLGQLPFQDLPFQEDRPASVLEKTRSLAQKFDRLILLGMGGSCLGAEFLCGALGNSGPRVLFCDHVDATVWTRWADELDWNRTGLLVVSKSGRTIETWSAFLFFAEHLKKKRGASWKDHVLIMTDGAEGFLLEAARSERLDYVALPPGVGGRFSVLTVAGLIPAAFAGVDISELLAGARRMDERCRNEDLWLNPAGMGAALHYLMVFEKKKTIRILLPYGESLRPFGPWFAQLGAESLGKRTSLKGKEIRAGGTPLCGGGPRDQHSQLQLHLDGPRDKTVTFIDVEDTADVAVPPLLGNFKPGFPLPPSARRLQTWERLATEEALRESGCPNLTLLLKRLDAHSVGQLIFLMEMETVYAGGLWDVNPFDQPAVEKIKTRLRDYISGKIIPPRNREYQV